MSRESKKPIRRGRKPYNKGSQRMNRKKRGPRMEIRNKSLHVYVSYSQRLSDEIIRQDYLRVVISKLSRDEIDDVIFKARGQAINVAVRAALLLEETMGVMKKKIRISSTLDKQEKNKNAFKASNNKMVSSMEIEMKRF
ncbi:MAG: hypothetical protein ACTSVI_02905 [Promethearchaeota archaeon]